VDPDFPVQYDVNAATPTRQPMSPVVLTSQRRRAVSHKAKDPLNAATAVGLLYSPTPPRPRRVRVRKKTLPQGQKIPESPVPVRRVAFNLPGPSSDAADDVFSVNQLSTSVMLAPPLFHPMNQPSTSLTPAPPILHASNQQSTSTMPTPLPLFDLENATPPLASIGSSSESESSNSESDSGESQNVGPPSHSQHRTSSGGPAGNKNRYAASDVWTVYEKQGSQRCCQFCQFVFQHDVF
jgi:hypothetical protein